MRAAAAIPPKRNRGGRSDEEIGYPAAGKAGGRLRAETPMATQGEIASALRPTARSGTRISNRVTATIPTFTQLLSS